MLYKLTAKSFLRQSRGYLVYFFSLTFSTMIYYSLSTITHDEILNRRTSQESLFNGFFDIGNWVIMVVLLFFVISANRFFLNRRQKEIGIYQLFGVTKRQISLIYIMETMTMGLFACIAGILLGIIFSKLFSMILIRMMKMQLNSLFFISVPSIFETSLLLFSILSIVSLHSLWLIWRGTNLRSFGIYDHTKSTMLRIRTRHRLFGALGGLLISSGYFLAVHFREFVTKALDYIQDIRLMFVLFLTILFFCIVGTYLFFAYSLRVLIGLLNRSRIKYKGINFLLIGNTQIHLLKNWRINSLITLVIGISLTMIGGMMSGAAIITRITDMETPVSYQLDTKTAEKMRPILANEKQMIQNEMILNYKVVGSYFLDDIIKTDPQKIFQIVNLISERDYHAFRRFNPNMPKIDLTSNNSTVVLDSIKNFVRNVSIYGSTFYLPDKKLDIQATLPSFLGDNNMCYLGPTLIVSESVFNSIQGFDYQVINWNVQGGNEEKINERLAKEIPPVFANVIYYDYQIQEDTITGTIQDNKPQQKQETSNRYKNEDSRMNLVSRYPIRQSANQTIGTIAYISIFIGMIVMIATGSILMVRQLAEAEEEKGNYQLLTRLGVSQKKIKRMIFSQNAIMFLPPVILGSTHAIFAIKVLTQYIEAANYGLAYLICSLLILIYILFYFMTSVLYSRIIEE